MFVGGGGGGERRNNDDLGGSFSVLTLVTKAVAKQNITIRKILFFKKTRIFLGMKYLGKITVH